MAILRTPFSRSRKRGMIKCMIATSLYREILLMQDMDDNALNQTLLSYMEKQKVSAIRKEAAANRRFRQRKSWAAFNGNLTDRQFKRYFLMSRADTPLLQTLHAVRSLIWQFALNFLYSWLTHLSCRHYTPCGS